MTMKTKNEVFLRYLSEYIKANKQRKGEILKNVCDTTGMHQKAAIRKFRRLQLKGIPKIEKRGRKAVYTPDSIAALKTVWEAASEICGELLHQVIPEYVNILKRDKLWMHRDDATEKLLAMSEATVKRKVGNFLKARNWRKGQSTTKPSDLKEIIPIFTGPWDDLDPGHGQIDTVVHCGHTLLGNMAYSVNYTDVTTLWVSFGAQMNKGQKATRDNLKRIKAKVPFPIYSMHPDTGSEFINWHVKNWADEAEIDFTRSRPNRKNDNAYVEQKNGHVIRRFLGYGRIDCPEAIVTMNKFYDKLELYINHFVPSRKCIKKIRVGSRYRRKYDKAKTPYRRVLSYDSIGREIKNELKEKHEKLNPLLLKREIDKLITEIFKIQKRYGDPNFMRQPK